MGKFEFNLPTIAGAIVLVIVLFMLVTTLIQQFIPTFRLVESNMGFMFIVIILVAIISITIIKKEFSFNRSEILPLLIIVGLFIALIIFYPKLLSNTMFRGSVIQLKNAIGMP